MRTPANKPGRIPYALSHGIFAPPSRLKRGYKRLEPMRNGQRDALYSNRTATVMLRILLRIFNGPPLPPVSKEGEKVGQV